MAQGLEVLQAALDGKRVRLKNYDRWYRYAPGGGCFVEKDGKAWNPPLLTVMLSEWDIEEPTLTFIEAVAAMDAGQTVERAVDRCNNGEPDELIQMRNCSHDADEEYYEIRHQRYGRWDPWVKRLGFPKADVHATDWRVVTGEPQDELPTAEEAIQVIQDAIKHPMIKDTEAAEVQFCLKQRWPAMFRKEDA